MSVFPYAALLRGAAAAAWGERVSRYVSAFRTPSTESPISPIEELHSLQIHPRNASVSWEWSKNNLDTRPQHSHGLPAGGRTCFCFSLATTCTRWLWHGRQAEFRYSLPVRGLCELM